MPKEFNLEIIVGTYEDFIAGYKLEAGKRLNLSFSDRAHSGSVRSIDSSQEGRLVASSGIDENIHVFDLKKRTEISQIRSDNDGAINCVKFYDKSHLFAASEDGNIYIYDCRQGFKLLKTLQGHKKGVTWLSVHPSGKILLSVSKDGTLRTWNLIKGRCAYVTNLKLTAHFVSWSISGAYFLIAVNNAIDVYNVADGTISQTVTFGKRVNFVEFLTENIVAVASDSPQLEFYDLKGKTSLIKLDAHENRLKAVKIIHHKQGTKAGAQEDQNKEEEEDEEEDEAGGEQGEERHKDIKYFVTISSDTSVKLWSLYLDPEDKKIQNLQSPKLVASATTGARLTCLTALTF